MENSRLSNRQLEVLKLLTMSNKNIAKQLGISAETVRTHLSDIYKVLGVSSRTGAVVRCLKLGWISLDEVSTAEVPQTSKTLMREGRMKSYRLSVSGVVKFDERDHHVESLLLGEQSPMQVKVALQELEEEAQDIRVEMKVDRGER